MFENALQNTIQFLNPYLILSIALCFFIYFLSLKFKFPYAIILIFLGVLIKNYSINNYSITSIINYVDISFFLFYFALLIILILFFVMINEFSFHEMDLYSIKGMKISLISLSFNVLFLSFALNFLFKLNFYFSLLLAIILTTTDFNIYNHLIKKNRVFEFLKYESIFGTLLSLLLVFFILSFFRENLNFFQLKDIAFNNTIIATLLNNLLGFSIGLIIAIIFFDVFKKLNHWLLEIFVFVFVILSYVIAELLNTNGLFSVLAFSLFFERLLLNRKEKIKQFFKKISLLASSFVFLLLGLLLPKIDFSFLTNIFVLFLLYLLLRFLSLIIAFHSFHESIKDIIFMALNCAKGVDVISISIILNYLFKNNISLNIISNIFIYFVFFSIITSFFAIYFLNTKDRTKKSID
ncbi:MAG: cation:proton antiporter [Candidatus Woesearchaeota archaeon]